MGFVDWEIRPIFVLCLSLLLAVVETGDSWQVKTKGENNQLYPYDYTNQFQLYFN